MTAPSDRNINEWLKSVQASWRRHYDEPFEEVATKERLYEAWLREEGISDTVEALRVSFVAARLVAKQAEERALLAAEPLAESLDEQAEVPVLVESPSFPAPLSMSVPDTDAAVLAIAASVHEVGVEYKLHVERGLPTPADAQTNESEMAK